MASTTSVANVTVNNTSLYYLCHESSIDVTVVAVNGAGDGYPATFSGLICPLPSRKSNYFLSEDIIMYTLHKYACTCKTLSAVTNIVFLLSFAV